MEKGKMGKRGGGSGDKAPKKENVRPKLTGEELQVKRGENARGRRGDGAT